ncbi:MAG TPA: 2,3,4,5-tetrahydropyridine-2,6-dicarboxylate N-succinyltransferase [Myxococcales bacterium]|nr:2,3,4,5-tetrahydropyridine-2,6-dicarboxylate N-succinyltransferase [Myxococcales bacterium]
MTDFTDVRRRVEAAWADPDQATQDHDMIGAIRGTIAALDRGELRAAVKTKEGWRANEWVKQAILLFFKIAQMEHTEVGPFEYYDKIPLKHGLERAGVRVVPPGVARYGSFLEAGAILMPGYVNIGARVGAGTLVDTWATVGSCAQVGRNVHLSGGVGLGGVLEPPSAMPVVVEDDCFIGSRCILVEGVIVETGAVLGANVVITSSTPILDVTGPAEKVIKGRVPARSVVVPGTRAKQFPAGAYQLPCALIIGQRSDSTDRKTSLNEVLRQFAVPT